MRHLSLIRPLALGFATTGLLLGATPVVAAVFDSVSNTTSSPTDPRTNAPYPAVPLSTTIIPTPGGTAIIPNTGRGPAEINLPPSQGIKTPDQTSAPKQITVDPNGKPLRSDDSTPLRHDATGN